MEDRKIKISEEEKELLRKKRNISKAIELKSDDPEISFGAIPDNILRDPSLSDREVRLWGILHSFATPKRLEKTPKVEKKEAKQEKFAEFLGCHRSTVSRCLCRMHKRGLITVIRPYSGKPNVILLHGTERKRR